MEGSYLDIKSKIQRQILSDCKKLYGYFKTREPKICWFPTADTQTVQRIFVLCRLGLSISRHAVSTPSRLQYMIESIASLLETLSFKKGNDLTDTNQANS